MKRTIVISAAIVIVCVFIKASVWFLSISATFKPRVVLSAQAPNGVEMCVFQEFTVSTEPYQTAFYSRRPGEVWGWFYYDHQDLPWISGRIVLDPTNNVATIFRGRKAVGSFYWDRNQFVHFLRGTTNGPASQPNLWTAPP